jgi:phasin
LAPKAHIFSKGRPTKAADGKAPFPDNAERPLRLQARSFQAAASCLVTPRGTIMNATPNPEVAADKARARYPKGNGQFEALTFDTAFPETARAFVEKTLAQAREAYDRSTGAFEVAVDTMQKSFDAAGQGAVALNRKILDIAQRNVSSGYDLAKSLAGAKNLADFVELQTAYWQKQLDALTAQAEEVRALSTKVTADTAEPIKAHVTSSMEELRKSS